MTTKMASIWYGYDGRFTRVPNMLLKHRTKLGLTQTEVFFIIALLFFKWTPADPFPSVALLVELLGWNERTVQRTRAGLEKKGMLKVVPRPYNSNSYSLRPLFEKLKQIEAAASVAPAATAQTANPAPEPAPQALVQEQPPAPSPEPATAQATQAQESMFGEAADSEPENEEPVAAEPPAQEPASPPAAVQVQAQAQPSAPAVPNGLPPGGGWVLKKPSPKKASEASEPAPRSGVLEAANQLKDQPKPRDLDVSEVDPDAYADAYEPVRPPPSERQRLYRAADLEPYGIIDIIRQSWRKARRDLDRRLGESWVIPYAEVQQIISEVAADRAEIPHPDLVSIVQRVEKLLGLDEYTSSGLVMPRWKTAPSLAAGSQG